MTDIADTPTGTDDTAGDATTARRTPRPSRRTVAATGGGDGTRRAVRRDAEQARAAARQRVAVAQQVSEAVDRYHDAADRIDAAHEQLKAAGVERADAITVMRRCGLTVPEIATLTGLSASRVQALLHTP